MKTLIIDDMKHKQEEVQYALKELGLTDYETATCVTDAYLKIRQEKYDLLISDLGLPRHQNSDVENSLEGLEMLTVLGHQNFNIPTIVYSTTEIPADDLEFLKGLDYPYLGQAKDIESLVNIASNYLNKTDKKAR